MIRMHGRISGAVILLAMTALLLTGCTSEASSISSAKNKADGTDAVDTGFTMSTVGSYDSADTAVVLMTDETNKAVVLINMETGKQYTLYYDGTTYVKDKHDGPMTISQIQAGDVVDVTFLKGRKKLASIQLSPRAWVYDNVYNYDLAGANGTASIGSRKYSLPEGAVVLSEGKRVDKAEVVSQDVVTFSGIDHEIYSVSVDKGHGYLRLKNDQPLLGGWIEVGNSVIRQITEDMLLVVPEGKYEVTLTNNNISCVKNIAVERNKEVVLDVSDVEIAEDATGKILFSVTPETAKVSVDGNPVDIEKVVELPYGIHRVEATASGYDTLTKHIQVGSEYATISFTLEETRKEDSDRDSVSENSITREPWEDTYKPAEVNSVSDNTLSSVSENALGTSNGNKVYVDSPKGVEVYLDGNYVGLSPVRFAKTAGRHEITLRKDGYESKTYTIYLENDKRDETYSFSELVKLSPVAATDQKIPSPVISAVSGIADCRITDGTDVLTAVNPTTGACDATLQESGIEAVVAAAKIAVQRKVGEAEAAKYTFTVKDVLENVTVPDDTQDGKGTVSVTISRKGYVEQTVSCGVVIVKKAEGSEPKQEVSPVWMIIPGEAEEAIERIVIDGGDCGVDFPEKLSIGVHTIEVEAAGYEKWTGEIEITEDGDAIEINLVQKTVKEVSPVWMIISEDAENAITKIVIDGKDYGSDFPEKIPSGSHTITVEAAGYEEWTKEVEVTEDGDTIEINLVQEKNLEEGEGEPTEEETPSEPTVPTESGTEEGDKKDETIEEGNPSDIEENDKNDGNGKTEGSDTPETTTDTTNTTDKLTEETVTIKQNAHPIRDFFSSLFK